MNSSDFRALYWRLLFLGHLTEQTILVVFPLSIRIVHAFEPHKSLSYDVKVIAILALFDEHLPRRIPNFLEHLEQLDLLPNSIRLEKRYVLTQELLIPRVVHPEGFFHLEVVFVRDLDHEAVSETALNVSGVVLDVVLEDFLVEIVREILDQRLRHLI